MRKALVKKGIRVKYDNRDTQRPGWKFAEYEFKGVPIRIAIGPKDMESGTVEVARRDTREKEVLQQVDLDTKIFNLLEQIQDNLYKKALTFREQNIHHADTWEEFKTTINTKPGFIMAHWDGTAETEQKIKDETKATIRCIPLTQNEIDKKPGLCIYSGKPSEHRVVFALSY
jgi:prolyl-tRNA synthetase